MGHRPIDGTTNFFYGNPTFSISIAASDSDGALEPNRWDIEAGGLVIGESGRVARAVAGVLDGTPNLVAGPEGLVDELTALLLRAGAR